MNKLYANALRVCFPELPILSLLVAGFWLAHHYPL